MHKYTRLVSFYQQRTPKKRPKKEQGLIIYCLCHIFLIVLQPFLIFYRQIKVLVCVESVRFSGLRERCMIRESENNFINSYIYRV